MTVKINIKDNKNYGRLLINTQKSIHFSLANHW